MIKEEKAFLPILNSGEREDTTIGSGDSSFTFLEEFISVRS